MTTPPDEDAPIYAALQAWCGRWWPDSEQWRKLAIIVLTTIFAMTYLFYRLFSPVASASPEHHYVEHEAVDYYIAFDRSSSIDPATYPGIQAGLRQLIRADIGDRLSCLIFADGTIPERVPRPGAADNCRAQLWEPPPKAFVTQTRFDILFHRVHTRLRSGRANSTERRRTLVVVVSDGVPSDGATSGGCPTDDEPFITPQVVLSLTQLLSGEAKPLVALVLAGHRGACMGDIQSRWREAITHPSFSVVDYADDATGLLATALDRAQPVRLEPRRALDESERRNLDAGNPFSAEFRAWSYFKGGSQTFTHATLASGDDDVARLRVFGDCEDDSSFTVEVKAPAMKHPEGEWSRAPACFVFENALGNPPPSEMTTYVLHFDSYLAAMTYPLEIDPVPAKLRKARLLKRIGRTFALDFFLFVVWGVVMLIAAVATEPGSRFRRFNTRFIYAPRGDFFLAIEMLTINACIALGCVYHPGGIVFISLPILLVVNSVRASVLKKRLLPFVEYVALPSLEIFAFWVASRVAH